MSTTRITSRSTRLARLQSYHLPSSLLLPRPFVPTLASAAALHAELRQEFIRHGGDTEKNRFDVASLFPTPTGEDSPAFVPGHAIGPGPAQAAAPATAAAATVRPQAPLKDWSNPVQLAPAMKPPHPAVISFRPAPTYRCTTAPEPGRSNWLNILAEPMRIACQHPGARGPHERFVERSHFHVPATVLVDQGRPLAQGLPEFTHTAYLGPGQLVFWPVVDLESPTHSRITSIKNYIQILMATTIAALKLVHPEGMDGSKRYYLGRDRAPVGLPWEGILLGSVWVKRFGKRKPSLRPSAILPRELLAPGNPRSQVLGRVATLWDMGPRPMSLAFNDSAWWEEQHAQHLPNIAVAIDMTTIVMRPGPWARLAYCHGARATAAVPVTDMASWHRDSHVEWDEALVPEVLRAAWEEQFIARLHRHYPDDDVFTAEHLVGNQIIADQEMLSREYLKIKPSYEATQLAQIRGNRWLREAAGLGKDSSKGDASLRTWSGWIDKRDPADVLGPGWAPENVYIAEVHHQATPPAGSELKTGQAQDELDDQAIGKKAADPPAGGRGPGKQNRQSPPSDGKISVLSNEPGKVYQDPITMELHQELVALMKIKGRDVGPLRLLPDPRQEELDPEWVKKEMLKERQMSMTERARMRNLLNQKPQPGGGAKPRWITRGSQQLHRKRRGEAAAAGSDNIAPRSKRESTRGRPTARW